MELCVDDFRVNMFYLCIAARRAAVRCRCSYYRTKKRNEARRRIRIKIGAASGVCGTYGIRALPCTRPPTQIFSPTATRHAPINLFHRRHAHLPHEQTPSTFKKGSHSLPLRCPIPSPNPFSITAARCSRAMSRHN